MEAYPFLQSDVNSIADMQPEGWGDICTQFEFYTGSPFCFPVKVIVDNKIVGIGATITHHEVAWLGHIIVHPEYRNRGIGRLITQSLVEIANEKDCETINLIATDLGAPVYEKTGFVTETEYLFFKDVSISDSMPVSGNIAPFQEDFREAVYRIDRKNSGEDRSVQLAMHIHNAVVFKQADSVEGFYLPTLGEGLIIANTPDAGLSLLKFHLATNERVILPKENSMAISFLYKNGFMEVRTARRMRLGKKRAVMYSNIYNRIAGNIG